MTVSDSLKLILTPKIGRPQPRMRPWPERRMRRSADASHATRLGDAHVRPRRVAHAPPGATPYIARRPANALPRVTSSAYSRSDPTGKPLARRVTVSAGARSRSS
jgi:hypothetical protein